MCGRYTLTFSLEELRAAFPEVVFNITDFSPRYNVAPTQMIPVIRRNPKGDLQADMLKWGLIPSWADDPTIGIRLINARSETVAEKPSYRNAFKSRRCLIPADGFFEWVNIATPKNKQPIYFFQKSGKDSRPIFAFAGLWEYWKSTKGEEIRSATIITTEPNKLVGRFHDRMPVVLPKDAYKDWLNPETSQGNLSNMLRPYPDVLMEYYFVSKLVNSSKIDTKDLIAPLQNI